MHYMEKTYSCKHCEKKFASSGSLLSHVKTKHDFSSPSLKCEFCGFGAHYLSMLNNHINRVHMEKSSGFTCDTCGAKIKELIDFKKHLTIHSSKDKHSCNFCGKQFNYGGNLKKTH